MVRTAVGGLAVLLSLFSCCSLVEGLKLEEKNRLSCMNRIEVYQAMTPEYAYLFSKESCM